MSYKCNKYGAPAYFDGRCGDGLVLLCGCDQVNENTPKEEIYYDGRCGDGLIRLTDAKPIKDNGGK